jgi:2-polyprenyl-3-methyl-5-hydroxy-6-metoxy-1,4-benzoquinol methylase
MTDFGKIKDYGDFVRQDPFRNGLHYPAVLQKLGRVSKRRILDVGCGDGRFPRLMAEQGASVVGYDMAPEKIEEAQAVEEKSSLGIRYVVATPQTFRSPEDFDDATSVLVLPYSPTVGDLTEFFRSTSKHLLDHGRFVSVVFNPQFSDFGKNLGSRRFTKLEGNDVQVEFIDPMSQETKFTSVLHQFTREEYEAALEEENLGKVVWEKLFATRESIDALGNSFWEACHATQPYSLLTAGRK